MRLPNLLEHDTLHEVSTWKIGFSSMGFLLNEDIRYGPDLVFFSLCQCYNNIPSEETSCSNDLSMTHYSDFK
jgi:hypothetical protein